MNYNSISSHEWGNVVYILILIVLLIMGFSRKELPTKKIFEFTGLWILLALVALIFYSYRFEIVEKKDRVLSDLFPAKAINKNYEKLILNIAQDGHFYLNVKINVFYNRCSLIFVITKYFV